MQRAPTLCGVWGRVSVASLTLACAMRGDYDSNPGPSDHDSTACTRPKSLVYALVSPSDFYYAHLHRFIYYRGHNPR